MAPKARVAKSTTQTYLFVRSDHSRAETASASDDQHAAHGRRALFGQMGLGPVVAHMLPHLEPPEPGDHGLAEKKAHDQRGQDRAGAPEGDVLEDIEPAENCLLSG